MAEFDELMELLCNFRHGTGEDGWNFLLSNSNLFYVKTVQGLVNHYSWSIFGIAASDYCPNPNLIIRSHGKGMKNGFLDSGGRNNNHKKKKGTSDGSTTMPSMVKEGAGVEFASTLEGFSSTSLAEKIRVIEKQMVEGKLVLLGYDGLPLKPSRTTSEDSSLKQGDIFGFGKEEQQS
ncbi:hypothetical protein Tco_0363370 [Tanacetum coccineum]